MSVFSPFLGKGAKYNFGFDEVTGGVKKASSENYSTNNTSVANKDLEKINGSLAFIFSTSLGERFFLPEFGSNLYKLVFEPNDDIFTDSLRVFISSAIAKWEKRIILMGIDIQTTNNELENNTARVNVKYQIISSQVVGNFIYPFVRRI